MTPHSQDRLNIYHPFAVRRGHIPSGMHTFSFPIVLTELYGRGSCTWPFQNHIFSDTTTSCSSSSHPAATFSIPEKMKNASDTSLERTQFSFQAQPTGLQRRKYQRYPKIHSTYLGLIACVIQKSPNKRLTFCQVRLVSSYSIFFVSAMT